LNYLPNLRRILSSAGCLPSLNHPLRIHDTPLRLDGAEREKYEGRVSGRVGTILRAFYPEIT